jgi:hypothetical protein
MRACLAALIFAMGVTEEPAKNIVQAFGIGGQSCAYWLSGPEREADGRSWALGFWTAYNNLNSDNHLVGKGSGAEAILNETKKVCAREPSKSLGAAIAGIYERFQQDGK